MTFPRLLPDLRWSGRPSLKAAGFHFIAHRRFPVSAVLLAGPDGIDQPETFDTVDYEADSMFNQTKWTDAFDQGN
jgi:hypothetical protein